MLVVKVDKCLGCKSCEIACALEHAASEELSEAIREETRPQSRVQVGQGAGFAVPLQCRQCGDAPCMKICPVDALQRADADSPIVIDHDLCTKCMYCVLACPFGVIRFNKADKTIVKCDLCVERVAAGGLPACVSACPTNALEFKTVDEVVAEKQAVYLLEIQGSLSGERAGAL